MASKPKLKPCPFCGGEAQLLRISKLPNGVEEWFVSCGAASCDLYPHSTIPYASAEIAAAAWNRRAVDTPSNAAVLREALANLVDVIDRCDSGSPLWWHCGAKGVKPLKDAKAALAAPPRQCDVGDAADWEKRFGEECDKGHICSDCPVRHAKTKMAIELDKGARCEFIWAQMPYNESEVAV